MKRLQVYERTKAPLLTLMAGGSPETVYCILKHLEGMLPRCPGVFDDEFRQFFTRWGEAGGGGEAQGSAPRRRSVHGSRRVAPGAKPRRPWSMTRAYILPLSREHSWANGAASTRYVVVLVVCRWSWLIPSLVDGHPPERPCVGSSPASCPRVTSWCS